MNIKRLVLISGMWGFAILLVTVVHADAQAEPSQRAQQVEPMEKTPVFRTEVVSRTTKAVDYRHRGGSTRVDLKGTDLMRKRAAKPEWRARRDAWKSTRN